MDLAVTLGEEQLAFAYIWQCAGKGIEAAIAMITQYFKWSGQEPAPIQLAVAVSSSMLMQLQPFWASVRVNAAQCNVLDGYVSLETLCLDECLLPEAFPLQLPKLHLLSIVCASGARTVCHHPKSCVNIARFTLLVLYLHSALDQAICHVITIALQVSCENLLERCLGTCLLPARTIGPAVLESTEDSSIPQQAAQDSNVEGWKTTVGLHLDGTFN